MEKQILVEATIKYEISGEAFYCLDGCKYLRTRRNNEDILYKQCLLFGDFIRYILAPKNGRVPLRHIACIKCEQCYDVIIGKGVLEHE